MPDPTTIRSVDDLTAVAARISDALIAAAGLDSEPGLQQAMCLIEEAGELVGAYRRWAGMARRAGTFNDVADEFADVAITTAVAAHDLGVVLNGGHDLIGFSGLDDPGWFARTPLNKPSRRPGSTAVLAIAVRAARLGDHLTSGSAYVDEDAHLAQTAVLLTQVLGITTHAAWLVGVNLPAAINTKLGVIFSRGWRDQDGATS